MSNSAIDETRRQIESLDEKLHDLLMKRAEIVARLHDLQRKNGEGVLAQLPQETVLIRRLLARHRGTMPRESVARIWRELCASSLLAQDARKVAVTVPDPLSGPVQWDMAKDYFGGVVPLQKVINPLAALSLVKEKDVAFAVLPWPENDGLQGWWRFLLDENGDRPLRIVARLPLGELSSDNGNPLHKSLVVARVPYEGTGDDRSFIALQLEHRISRARIIDKANALGMKGISLYSCTSAHPDYNDHLLEVAGYVGTDRAPVENLLAVLESHDGKAAFVGGYPVPLLYDAQPQDGGSITSLKKRA